jgi:hypothetical protein
MGHLEKCNHKAKKTSQNLIVLVNISAQLVFRFSEKTGFFKTKTPLIMHIIKKDIL